MSTRKALRRFHFLRMMIRLCKRLISSFFSNDCLHFSSEDPDALLNLVLSYCTSVFVMVKPTLSLWVFSVTEG